MQGLRRIIILIWKEFKMVLKDPKSRIVVVGPPLIQFFVFGYAATFDLKNVRYAILDEASTTESRELSARFEASKTFKLVKNLSSCHEIASLLDNGEVRLVIHIGPEFSRKIHQAQTAQVQVLVDGRNSNVAMMALGYVGTIVTEYNQKIAAAEETNQDLPVLMLEERFWFNRNLESRWFIISALGGIISMVVVIIITSLSVAREREFGTFDQLLVAPFSPAEILIGKSIPGIVFGFFDALIFCIGAVYWFGVPFRGSVADLVLVLACFVIAIVGVGLLISSLSVTMQQALLGSFVFIMPAVILSGFTTPIANMPRWLQFGTLINPLRYIIEALRRIFLQGAETASIWPQLWPLIIMAFVTLPAAGWLFRHRMR
ncbi:MAG: ABC transporter permease [Desulfobacterales bacterium]